MRRIISKTFTQIFVRDFNMCFFISFFLLSLYPDPNSVFSKYESHEQNAFLYLFVPSFNGLFTALVTLILNNYFAKKNYTSIYYTSDKTKLAIVAFIAGFTSLYLSISELGTYIVSAIIIYISYINVKDFAAKISLLLAPNKMATPQDLGEFANFFINLIITFTIINLSINTIHSSLSLDKAFNFGQGISSIVDAWYFSIITMTTVGYGDIIPQNVIARIVVGFECLTSYVMLGIMIGIITRGITFNQVAVNIETQEITKIEKNNDKSNQKTS